MNSEERNQKMIKEYLLSQTLYGVRIMNHLIRKEYPDHIMHISGDDCGNNPDPVFTAGGQISINVAKTYTPGKTLPNRIAKYHYPDGSLPDGDALDLAKAYFIRRGKDLTEEQLIALLANELYIKEPGYNPYFHKPQNHQQRPHPQQAQPAEPPIPKMSFYRKPIRNTRPCREATPEDIYKYITSDYAKSHTEHLRTISDNKERSRYKADNLDYITPGGIFRSRKESDLIKPSGYMVIDFDHIPDARGLVTKLSGDEHFETVLTFRSPSGDGVKWIIALPHAAKPDGNPFTFLEFFIILSNYSRKVYGIEADPSGKDICRACFLPYDPNAYLNPSFKEKK